MSWSWCSWGVKAVCGCGQRQQVKVSPSRLSDHCRYAGAHPASLAGAHANLNVRSPSERGGGRPHPGAWLARSARGAGGCWARSHSGHDTNCSPPTLEFPVTWGGVRGLLLSPRPVSGSSAAPFCRAGRPCWGLTAAAQTHCPLVSLGRFRSSSGRAPAGDGGLRAWHRVRLSQKRPL